MKQVKLPTNDRIRSIEDSLILAPRQCIFDKKKRIAVHKHVAGCKIYEYMLPDGRRTFTASIFGWNNFHFVAPTMKAQDLFNKVLYTVTEIRNLLKDKSNDEQLTVIEELPQMYTF